jgi:uncharacterized protein (TIGR03437 family)
MNWPRRSLKLHVLFLLLSSSVIAGFSGSIQRNAAGHPLRWKANTAIPYVINPGGVPGFEGELQRLVVIGAVQDAFRLWTEIPDTALVFNYSGNSSQTTGAIDGTNLVSFQDTSYPFGPGVLGVALVASAVAPGPTSLGGQTVNAEFAGQILDADILFNPNAGNAFSPVGANNTLDLIAVGTHEVGHFLGLDHTSVLSSIMNPYSESGAGIASRAVRPEDTHTIAAYYPAATFAPARGSISGRVTSSGGAPVKAASVIAFSTTGGVPLASHLSTTDGSYSIDGLPPGNYHVFVEPLDGPISLSNFLPGFYFDGSNNFATTFVPASGAFTTLTVAAGQSTPLDITLADRSASTLNIETLGVRTTSGNSISFSFGPAPRFLPRGKSYDIFVTGPTLPANSNLTALGTGITSGATQAASLPSGAPIRLQTLTISSNAALGPSHLVLSDSSSASVLPGGIIVTINPQISTVRSYRGGTNLAPGDLVAISGSDLAEKAEAWDGPPAPTSLGGVSVRIGTRFAPLFYVSPTLIIAQVPHETAVSTVPVEVIAGPDAKGNTANLNLNAAAPEILTAGASQGIILNASDNTVAAQGGGFPGAHPARAGDTVVIYAAGLGAVNPALPSGLAAGASGTTVPTLAAAPSVRIGGQAAAVQSAGLAPGLVGVYLLRVTVPPGVQAGAAVPVVISAQGRDSNAATMAVN